MAGRGSLTVLLLTPERMQLARPMIKRAGAFLVPLLVAAMTLGSTAPDANAGGVVSAYTLVTPKDVSSTRLQVRAVIPSGTSCPKLSLRTRRGKVIDRSMTKRVPGPTTNPAFASLRACQANVPRLKAGIRSARVGAIAVPHRLPSTFGKIAMLGDTGCRVEVEGPDPSDIEVQGCSKTSGTNPADYWPLARNSQSIAAERPDLTVFTGDFFYRESPCPTASQYLLKCGGSPAPVDGYEFKDTDYAWVADVFIPMAPLFRAAPLLAVRGNHEQCRRGGNGWFLFFEVTTELGPDACAPEVAGGPTEPNITPSWAFDAPIRKGRTLRLVAVDSAYGRNFDVTDWVEEQRPAYEQARGLSKPQKGRESWLVTHRPMFGIEPEEEAVPGLLPWTSTDQAAAGKGLLGNYQMMVASHVHVAQVVKIPGQPVQMVIGNGGSKPDAASASSYVAPAYGPLANAAGEPLSPDYAPYPPASYDWTAVEYGYTVLKPGRKAKRWQVVHRDVEGKTFATCSLAGRSMTCTNGG